MRTYTEEELKKAIAYACEYQKACDYQMAGNMLCPEDENLIGKGIEDYLNWVSDGSLNGATELSIAIDEINEYLDN